MLYVQERPECHVIHVSCTMCVLLFAGNFSSSLRRQHQNVDEGTHKGHQGEYRQAAVAFKDNLIWISSKLLGDKLRASSSVLEKVALFYAATAESQLDAFMQAVMLKSMPAD